MARRSIVVIDDFYEDPNSVREYALNQKWFLPYLDKAADKPERWSSSVYKQYNQCPFKSSAPMIEQLEYAVNESIDMQHWNGAFPTDARGLAVGKSRDHNTCFWNCMFHVKHTQHDEAKGVHNHVVDSWNSVGNNGWAGIIYLSPDAPTDGGLRLWRNKDPKRNLKWMPKPDEWMQIDEFANIYNRMILVRGNIPHVGAQGWGDNIKNGRMFQTFFFKTASEDLPSISGINLSI